MFSYFLYRLFTDELLVSNTRLCVVTKCEFVRERRLGTLLSIQLSDFQKKNSLYCDTFLLGRARTNGIVSTKIGSALSVRLIFWIRRCERLMYVCFL